MSKQKNINTLTREAEQAWNNLSLASNFIFQKVMQNEELCIKVLSEILGIEIKKVEYPQYEKTIDIRYDSKSIRLDVYVKDENETIYNIEIQNLNSDSIPKRGRYYQGLIDLDLIEKGCYYKELNKSIVIFICSFDLYSLNQYIYSFTYKCDQIKDLEYGDETTKIIINTYGTEGDASEDFKDFLKCINGEFTSTDFSDKLKLEIDKVKRSRKFRREFMTLYLHEEEIRREYHELGKSEGLEIGRAEGLIEGTLLLAVKYYTKGRISLEEALKDTGLCETEFLKKVDIYNKK